MNNIKLLFAGDLIPPDTGGAVYSDSLLKLLRDKDFSIVNLETPLTDSTHKISKTGRNFKASSQGISVIKDGFFDAVALANNHIRDFNDEGVNDTLKIIRDNQILSVGAGENYDDASQPLRINIKGTNISILNYCEREFNIASKALAGANPFNIINTYYQIKEEKSISEYVIIIYHGGTEYFYYPTPELIEKFKFMADAGADSIISHHTHRYSGMINYNGKLLFFGLGNFLAHSISKFSLSEWRTGLVIKLALNSGVVKYELLPIKMSDDFKKVDLLEGDEKFRVLNHIDEISENIQNKNFLEEFWMKQDLLNTKKTLDLLGSNSRLEYRLRKYLPFLSRFRVSGYRLINLMGLIQNDSNRQRLIGSLEKILWSNIR